MTSGSEKPCTHRQRPASRAPLILIARRIQFQIRDAKFEIRDLRFGDLKISDSISDLNLEIADSENLEIGDRTQDSST
jgi:hypothetical protein